MNIRRIIIVIFALLLLSLSTSVAAQEAPVTRYDRTEYNLLWRGFSNPAAMASLQGKVISTADLSARNSLGSLCGVQESPMAVYAKISTATLARLSDKVAFSGGMFFNYNYGQNMGGPVMMDPSYNPVNFYESSDETRGVKVKELYGVNAKFAYTVAPAWTIGIGFDYEGGNMAKRKDPRYRNFWMDLKASLGFTFNPSESFAVGLSGMFR